MYDRYINILILLPCLLREVACIEWSKEQVNAFISTHTVPFVNRYALFIRNLLVLVLARSVYIQTYSLQAIRICRISLLACLSKFIPTQERSPSISIKSA